MAGKNGMSPGAGIETTVGRPLLIPRATKSGIRMDNFTGPKGCPQWNASMVQKNIILRDTWYLIEDIA
jgi:hypothetical protein